MTPGKEIGLLPKIALFFGKSIWGRNGFDGDKEAVVACRVPSSRKKMEPNIIADDYNYALAA